MSGAPARATRLQVAARTVHPDAARWEGVPAELGGPTVNAAVDLEQVGGFFEQYREQTQVPRHAWQRRIDAGNLTLDDDVLYGNQAAPRYGGPADGYGGNVYITDGSASGQHNTVTIDETLIRLGLAVNGAGIMEWPTSSDPTITTSLTITDSLIYGNNGSVGSGFEGPDDAVGSSPATVAMTNTTVVYNNADTAGGGLDIGNAGGSETFLNDTIAYDSAPTGGDIASGDDGASFENAIVADGDGPDGRSDGPDCYEAQTAIVSLGHNLDDADNCNFDGASDLVNTDPDLETLQDNGGPTETMALNLHSPAIDAGGNSPIACPPTDQRGVARPQGSACDVGAWEFAPPVMSGAVSSTASGTTATISGTISNPDVEDGYVTVNWGTSSGDYTGSSTAGPTLVPQTGPEGMNVDLAGLQPATTYYYEIVGFTQDIGTVVLFTGQFTTVEAGGQPTTVTTPVTNPANTATATPAPAPPSNHFTVTKFGVTSAGRLTVTLGAPAVGTFMIRGTFPVKTDVTLRKHGKRVVETRTTTYTYGSRMVKAAANGNQTLTISLSKAAAKQLVKLGRARVTLAITFTPTGGGSATQKLTVTVKRRANGKFS